MAGDRKAGQALLTEVALAIRSELLGALQPIVDRLSKHVAELQRMLQKATGPRTKGRARGKKLQVRKNGRQAGKRGPRGALQASIREILSAAFEPMSLTEIRDRVLKNRLFRGRNPRALYSQIIHTIQQSQEFEKNHKRLYSLKRK